MVKNRSRPIYMVFAILREIPQKYAGFSLKITKDRENYHLQSSRFTQMVKREIFFALNSHKF